MEKYPAIRPNQTGDFWKVFTNAAAIARICAEMETAGFSAGKKVRVFFAGKREEGKNFSMFY
jgi:hypothetical protein